MRGIELGLLMSRTIGIGLGALIVAGAALFAIEPALAGDGYTAPSPVAGQPAKYPTVSQRNGEEGAVAVKVYVMASGRIHDARLVGSSGNDRLDNAAVESVLGWKFNPAMQNGTPVDGTATVQVVYKVPAQ